MSMTSHKSGMKIWKCRRCKEPVQMKSSRCGCTESPSPWELVEPEEVAYDAYCRAVGGVAFNGDKLPEFTATPARIQAAWKAAIAAIIGV